MTTFKKCKRIQQLLAGAAGEQLAYETWSDEFCRQQLCELREAIRLQLGPVSLTSLTLAELDDLGFAGWGDDRSLRLIPVWLYSFLQPGDELESINEEKRMVGEEYESPTLPDGEANSGYIDNEHRGGYLVWGVWRPSEANHEERQVR